MFQQIRSFICILGFKNVSLGLSLSDIHSICQLFLSGISIISVLKKSRYISVFDTFSLIVFVFNYFRFNSLLFRFYPLPCNIPLSVFDLLHIFSKLVKYSFICHFLFNSASVFQKFSTDCLGCLGIYHMRLHYEGIWLILTQSHVVSHVRGRFLRC